jgi:hypothetical protein
VDALVPLRERPWGAVLRVVTSPACLVFKAVGARGAHEVGLLVDVAASQPTLAPELVAVDRERGWVLMRDHGERMTDVADIAQQVSLVERLLPAYAALQVTTAHRVGAWIAEGVPDRSARRLPPLLDGLLAGEGATGPLPIPPDELGAMAALRSTFARASDALDDGTLRPAIDHADMHGTNVVVDGGVPRLIDWGDACVAHPFTSLLVPIEWIAGRLPPAEVPDAVRRLVDAYREPWGDRARDEDLATAVWSGYVARAVMNDEQCVGGSPDDIADAQGEIVTLLRVWATKASQRDDPASMLLPAIAW